MVIRKETMKTESFGEQIKRHRIAAGKLIGGVAHEVGITPPYMGAIEANCASPGLVLQGKLIRALDCKITLDPTTPFPPATQKARKALKRKLREALKRELERERKK